MSREGKFQGLHQNLRNSYFRVFRVMGKVSYEMQGVQGPLDSLQGYQGPLDTLYTRVVLGIKMKMHAYSKH